MDRKGTWIQTYTGRKFWPLDPRPEDIDIRDIAHALSLICRFGGHCRQFYSVAQHSCIVAHYAAGSRDQLWGLLHDASEAYIGDVVSPIKKLLRQASPNFYDEANGRIMQAVCERFGMPADEPEGVKRLDLRAMATEKRDLLVPGLEWSHPGPDYPPFTFNIVPCSAEQAELDFLCLYGTLTGESPWVSPTS